MSIEVDDAAVAIEQLRKQLAETRAVMQDLLLEKLPKVYLLELGDDAAVYRLPRVRAFVYLDDAKAAGVSMVAYLKETISIGGLGPERHDHAGRQLPDRPAEPLSDRVEWEKGVGGIWRLRLRVPERYARFQHSYNYQITEVDVLTAA